MNFAVELGHRCTGPLYTVDVFDEVDQPNEREYLEVETLLCTEEILNTIREYFDGGNNIQNIDGIEDREDSNGELENVLVLTSIHDIAPGPGRAMIITYDGEYDMQRQRLVHLMYVIAQTFPQIPEAQEWSDTELDELADTDVEEEEADR